MTGTTYVDPTATISFHAKDYLSTFTTQDLTQAQTDALAAYNAAKALTPDFSLGNLTSSTTVSATAASRADGVTVVSLSSLNYNSNILTLNGTSTDVFVINDSGDFLFAQSQIALSGGLTANHVLFNLTGTNAGGHDVTIFKSTSVFNGTLLAPYRNVLYRDPGSWSGEIIGGETLKVYSGATFRGSLSNTATVTASNVTFDPGDTATASITVTGPSTKALLAVGADYAGAALPLGSVGAGTYYVSVDGVAAGDLGAAELARVQDALATLNTELAAQGVTLIETDASTLDLATVHVHFADSSVIGGAADGVLGVTVANDITLINGWDWYLGADAGQVGAQQYDFQTIVTHELGHTLGLGHSTDANSVMYPYLATGQVRRGLTAADLTRIDEGKEEGVPEPLLASGFNAAGVRDAAAPPAATGAAASGQGAPLPSTFGSVALAAPLSIARGPAGLDTPVSSFFAAGLAPWSSPAALSAGSGTAAVGLNGRGDGLGNTSVLVTATPVLGASQRGGLGSRRIDTLPLDTPAPVAPQSLRSDGPDGWGGDNTGAGQPAPLSDLDAAFADWGREVTAGQQPDANVAASAQEGAWLDVAGTTRDGSRPLSPWMVALVAVPGYAALVRDDESSRGRPTVSAQKRSAKGQR